MKLWLDDLRPCPDGWTWVKTAFEAIALLEQGQVTELSLDHDLGPPEAGTGYDVASFVESEAYHARIPRLRWALHSANPIGVERMRRAMQNADKYWTRGETE